MPPAVHTLSDFPEADYTWLCSMEGHAWAAQTALSKTAKKRFERDREKVGG